MSFSSCSMVFSRSFFVIFLDCLTSSLCASSLISTSALMESRISLVMVVGDAMLLVECHLRFTAACGFIQCIAHGIRNLVRIHDHHALAVTRRPPDGLYKG